MTDGRFAIVCSNERSFSVIRLLDEMKKQGLKDFFVIKYPDTSLYLDDKKIKVFRQSVEIDLSTIQCAVSRVSSGETDYAMTLLRQLQIAKIPVINSPDAILNCSNKFETLQLLQKEGINVPKTFYSAPKNIESFEATDRMLGKKKEVLVKLMKGSGGTGISRVKPKALPDVVETIWESGGDVHLQEFVKFATVKGRGRDIRIIVVGGEVVGGYQRIAAEGRFKANIHSSGQPRKYVITDEQKEIAIKSAKAVNGDIVGVDILSNAKKTENIVIEVNTSPGFEGFEQGAGVNIAKKIITYCVEKFRR